MSVMKSWEHLKISLEKIDVATEKFKTCIGSGGYGQVYKGVLSIDGKDTTVAVKRLNEQFGQGLKEFLTEIQLLSGQQHPNLISLLGYCDEGKEKIIIYEYAARGSLDRFIRRNCDESSTTLTWLQRLKICADAARGLDHLHNHIGGHRTIIHRDIKSANILIDENWVAKISDLGLSKLSVTGFGMSAIVSNGCGTQGYCEPEYYNSGVVTKKSDVYSFGIVLFEVLCGRLCIIKSDNGFILHEKSVKEYYNKGNFVKIIDPNLREHMRSYSMVKFSEIAYRCFHDDREQRPSMDIVAEELEETLSVQVAHELEEKRKHQVLRVILSGYWETKLPRDSEVLINMFNIPNDICSSKEKLVCHLREGLLFDQDNQHDKNEDEYWEKKLPHNYPHLIKMSNIPLKYTTKKELYLLFRQGFLADNGQLWFSMCKSTRGICSIQPSTHVLFKDSDYKTLETLSLPESRFKEVKKLGDDSGYKFTCRLESYMFSPDLDNYAWYLVFKLEDGHVLLKYDGPIFKAVYNLDGNFITIKITLKRPEEESGSSKSIDWERSRVEERDDGWLEARLTKPLSLKHHLENCQEVTVDLWAWNFRIGFFGGIIVEGVEFRPVVVENGWIMSGG
nr:serine-threonine/tyrosine-protein kinase catalytic domain-containing protein [Tanacetum cinerariifolium]